MVVLRGSGPAGPDASLESTTGYLSHEDSELLL